MIEEKIKELLKLDDIDWICHPITKQEAVIIWQEAQKELGEKITELLIKSRSSFKDGEKYNNFKEQLKELTKR